MSFTETFGTLLSRPWQCSVSIATVVEAICVAIDAPTKPAACARAPAVAHVEAPYAAESAYADELRAWLEEE